MNPNFARCFHFGSPNSLNDLLLFLSGEKIDGRHESVMSDELRMKSWLTRDNQQSNSSLFTFTLELNSWGVLGGLRSFKETFGREAENTRENIGRERADGDVIVFNGRVKIIPGNANAVFCPFQLSL